MMQSPVPVMVITPPAIVQPIDAASRVRVTVPPGAVTVGV